MVTIQKHLNQQTRRQTKKKQRSRNYIDIGTPQVPLHLRKFKKQPELLSDWESAT